jgi:hypothetical protein
MTDDASDAAPLAVATTAPAATLATLRMVLTELPADAGFLALAGFAATLAATPGTTFFGAALPKAGFASLERSAIAGPAPAFAWVALAGVALDLAAAGFLALVAIGRNPSVAKLPRQR